MPPSRSPTSRPSPQSRSRRRAHSCTATCHGESKGLVLPRVAGPRRALRPPPPPQPQQRRVHMLRRPSPQAVVRRSRRRPEREAAAHQLLQRRGGPRPQQQQRHAHAAHPEDAQRQAPLRRALTHAAPRAGLLLPRRVGRTGTRRRREDAENPRQAGPGQRQAGQAAPLVPLRSPGGGADDAALSVRRPRHRPRWQQQQQKPRGGGDGSGGCRRGDVLQRRVRAALQGGLLPGGRGRGHHPGLLPRPPGAAGVQGAQEPGEDSGGGAGRVRAAAGGGGHPLHAGDGAAAGARARPADAGRGQTRTTGGAALAELTGGCMLGRQQESEMIKKCTNKVQAVWNVLFV